ncbi:MAG: hypothetical protein JSU86_18880 [Phycisphaerales bacterium]|nr:MAG: hypothetical protein JSU86_18880 [Phycisphaerales bacterium]
MDRFGQKTFRRANACVVASVSVILWSLGDRSFAEDGFTYHSAEYGYSLTVPEGWMRIADDVVEQMAKQVLPEQAQQNVIYDTAFQLETATGWFQYPYVLIHVVPYSTFGLDRQINEDEFDDVLKGVTGLDAEEILDGGVKSPHRPVLTAEAFGAARLDRANRRFAYNMQVTSVDFGMVQAEAYGHFGRETMVQVVFYGVGDEWSEDEVARSQILESFGFDPSHAYRETEKTRLRSGWRNWGMTVLTMAIIGAVAGSIWGLVELLRSRKRKANRPDRGGGSSDSTADRRA